MRRRVCRLVGAPDRLDRAAGFLFYAPPSETLRWDVENMTTTHARRWIEEEQAWWIAASYRGTIEDIARRHGLTIRAPGASRPRAARIAR